MAVANIPDQAQYGGYEFMFTKPVPDRFYCSICTKVLRDPHLTECCGQHFCDSCLKNWLKKQKTCPHCRQKNFNHMRDKAVQRDINHLEIRCTKQGLGCQWVGGLSSLQTHLDTNKGCGYVEIQCNKKCGAKMKRKDLKAHLEQCPQCKFQCQYCQYENTYWTITSKHYGECPHYPLPCPNKCGTTGIRRADMDNHRSSCELEPVECPFREAGCQVNVVRKEFDSHMSGNQQTHLQVLLVAFQKTKRKLDESHTKLDENQTKLGMCLRELDVCRRELVKNRGELNDCQTKLHNTRLKLLQLEENQFKQMALTEDGNEVIFCMYDYSLYKHTGKVWYSPPFYYKDGYRLCLAVYANGKGAGAGTHVSVELLYQEPTELQQRNQPYSWSRSRPDMHEQSIISIEMMSQKKKAEAPKKKSWALAPENEFLLCCHICSNCFTHSHNPYPQLCEFSPCDVGEEVHDHQFIDHQSAEQVMVLNDTITLRASLKVTEGNARWGYWH